jgi:hypothetical protein
MRKLRPFDNDDSATGEKAIVECASHDEEQNNRNGLHDCLFL